MRESDRQRRLLMAAVLAVGAAVVGGLAATVEGTAWRVVMIVFAALLLFGAGWAIGSTSGGRSKDGRDDGG